VTLVQGGEIVDEVHSDAAGGYRMTDLPGGQYGMSVSASGHDPVATLLTFLEGEQVWHDVVLALAGEKIQTDAPASGEPAGNGRRGDAVSVSVAENGSAATAARRSATSNGVAANGAVANGAGGDEAVAHGRAIDGPDGDGTVADGGESIGDAARLAGARRS
jgi:hypothetical protein